MTPAVWNKATTACKDLQPPGSLSSKRTPKEQSASLRFAACIRENGVQGLPGSRRRRAPRQHVQDPVLATSPAAWPCSMRRCTRAATSWTRRLGARGDAEDDGRWPRRPCWSWRPAAWSRCRARSSPAAAARAPAADTAEVVSGDLSAMVSQGGTLGYRARSDGSPYPVINRARGIYTSLPDSGDKVGCGGVLYRVDDRPGGAAVRHDPGLPRPARGRHGPGRPPAQPQPARARRRRRRPSPHGRSRRSRRSSGASAPM